MKAETCSGIMKEIVALCFTFIIDGPIRQAPSWLHSKIYCDTRFHLTDFLFSFADNCRKRQGSHCHGGGFSLLEADPGECRRQG